jgi:hypothetical protein
VAVDRKFAFSFLLTSKESALGECRLELVIRFANGNGKQT